MVKRGRIEIKKTMSLEELDQRIKKLEKDMKVLNRLHFIRNSILEILWKLQHRNLELPKDWVYM